MQANIIQRLTLQHFHAMEQLEHQFYGAEYITPAEEAWLWYQQHPNTTVAAEVAGRLVGFVNLFPVKPGVYQALLAGQFNDHFMQLEDVAPAESSPLHMFLSCVVMDKDFRHRGITRKLLQTALSPYAGRECVGVVTDNVTEAGCRFSERLGFTRHCRSQHNSWIYTQSWPEFEKSVNSTGT